MSLTRMAMASTVTHPGVTSAIIGPRTAAQLDDLIAGAGIVLGDGVLDEVVAPGTDLGAPGIAYVPPAVANPAPRRRPSGERAAV